METAKEFTANDRCDADCNSQAYHEVTSPVSGMKLLFCAHHMNASRGYFIMNGWLVDSDITGLENIGYDPVKV